MLYIFLKAFQLWRTHHSCWMFENEKADLGLSGSWTSRIDCGHVLMLTQCMEPSHWYMKMNIRCGEGLSPCDPNVAQCANRALIKEISPTVSSSQLADSAPEIRYTNQLTSPYCSMAPSSDQSLHVAPAIPSQSGIFPDTSPPPVTIIVTLQPKPNHLARLLDLCRDVYFHSKEHEPGCLISSIYLEREAQEGKEKKIYLFQKFIDEEAFQDHVGTEQHASVLAEIKDKDMLEESIVQSKFYMEKVGGFDTKKFAGNRNKSPMNDSCGWNVISVLHPKHGALNQLLHVCRQVTHFSMNEPGCRKMEVFRQCFPPNDQPAKVIMMEEYDDHLAFEHHLQAENIKKLMHRCETQLLAKPIEKSSSDLCWGFDNE